ncbi:hypothetical protein NOR_05732 [Metarhizium rileyi]|uniref:Protein CCC1 n=1 Tax=Metarhizium rileyi (strain RCEF 4871) TaxID=1649241 RepID=A0A167C0N4_METRR|nr:hypothetical protein NOR_05732 [Metarhizium rileyi RCEF 4871]
MSSPTESSPLLPAEPSSETPFPGAHDSKSANLQWASSTSSPGTTSHFDYSDTLRDVIIGFSDGLTVPFALTAGLSSLGSTKLVIMGGLAELFSGMISMGLGAYLAAATERDTYASQEKHERARAPLPHQRHADIHAILERYDVSRAAAEPLAHELCVDPVRWLRFTMDFSRCPNVPGARRAWISGLTMGTSYFVGGLVPMLPYFLWRSIRDALAVSVLVTVVILLAFGYAKNYVAIRNHRAGVWGALQTLVIGVLAAGTSYLIVKALDRGEL